MIKIILITILGISVLTPSVVFGESFPPFPMALWGNATINNSPAPVESVVRAYLNGTLVGKVIIQEAGIYGYTESTKQKLLIGNASGTVTFAIQHLSLNNGTEIFSTDSEQFASGSTINKDFSFSFTLQTPPVSAPASASSGGGGGGSGYYYSSDKAITTFAIPGQIGTTVINESAHTIALTMPYGTNVTAFIPTITITGASVSPINATSTNFTTPQTYTVTAANGSTQTYTVAVTVALTTLTLVPAPAIGQVLGATTFRFTATLRKGSKGDDVTELQNRLTAEGVYSGPITGYFGSLTEAGVKAYQKKYSIDTAGIVGPVTMAKLNSSSVQATIQGQVLGVSTSAETEAKITALKTQIASLLTQLLKLLQDQAASLQAK